MNTEGALPNLPVYTSDDLAFYDLVRPLQGFPSVTESAELEALLAENWTAYKKAWEEHNSADIAKYDVRVNYQIIPAMRRLGYPEDRIDSIVGIG